jgi:transposase
LEIRGKFCWRKILVDQLKAWKNRSKLTDSFDFTFNLKLIEPQIWRDLYQTQGLSAAQIAAKFGAPKSTVLNILQQLGLSCQSNKGRSTRADNYRAPNPPYGYKVLAGKLKADPSELKVCRLIVSLVRDKKYSWSAAADELNRLGVPSRKRGKSKWHRHIVRTIYKRWNKQL